MNRKSNNQTTGNEADTLLKMKQELESKKTRVTALRTQLDMYTSQLKEQFGLDSVEQADKELERMGKELDKKEGALNRRINALAQKYTWDFQNEA